MKFTRLLYIDSFGIGPFHETFNSSSLKMMSEIFSDIEYYSTKSSFEAVCNLFKNMPEHIHHHNLFIFKPSGIIGRFMQLFSSFWINIFLVVFKLHHDDIAFINYNTLWSIPFINWYCRYSKKRVIVMWHGELEFLYNHQKVNFISNKALHWIQHDDIKIAETFYFCVAGNSIMKNLHLIVAKPFINHFISFEHTFIPQYRRSSIVLSKSTMINVGTVGTIQSYKGLNNILKMGNILESQDYIQLYALGRVFCDVKLLNDNNIKFINGADKDFVSKEILDKSIDQMDVLIFLYPTDKYKLTASGAIFDSIDREIPILSLHNDYFDEMFSRVFIGYQFESIEQMAKYICGLNKNNMPSINFSKAKYILSPEVEARTFASTLRTIFPNLKLKQI